MADALARRQRATEEAFFKAEQEKAVMEYLEKLLASGRDVKSIDIPKHNANASVLPQISAHSVRLEKASKVEERRLQQFYTFQQGNRNKYFNPTSVLHRPMYVDKAMLGTQVSLGRAKWTAGHTTVEGTTIFDVSAGAKLAGEAPKQIRQAPVKAPAPQELFSLGSYKIKVMPEYTPGRALAWGSILALWGTAALVLRSAKALEINSLEEVGPKMAFAMQAPKEAAREAIKPVAAAAATLQNTDTNAFSSKLRSTLVKGSA